MTETQAKSGVTGASTDAAEAPVDSSPSKDDVAMTASGPEPAAPESSSAMAGSTTSDAAPRPSHGTDKGSSGDAPSSRPSGPAFSGLSSGSGLRASGDKDDGKAEPTVRIPLDAQSSAPVIAGYGSAKGASGSASVVPPPASHATGTASVSSTGHTPVIARATVAPPTSAPGALRQASGSSPVITPSRASSAVGAARVSDAVRTARATVAGAARGPRRARLHLKRIDPWSVMKFSFAVSLVLFVVAIVATSVLYLALDAMGVFKSLNQAMAEITGDAGTAADTFKITAKGVIGTSVLLGAVNMVLFTALMTLGAFVYNVCADLVGGVELTLSEKE